MKVVIINKSDSTGGAAVVSARLMEALRGCGVDARMLVAEKLKDSPFIERCASEKALRIPFLAERLKIFVKNGFSRDTLFKIDTASDGVSIWKHPWVREADVVCLNWVNQGMVSFKGVKRILDMGKPVVWTMHDMWCFTGICHHAGSCIGYLRECGNCPLLGKRGGKNDLSRKIWKKKKELYSGGRITFVAVSGWLAGLARNSSLLKDQDVEVIPNAFSISSEYSDKKEKTGKRIVFGAARLDDPIKGLPILMEATRILGKEYPEEASKLTLVTFGNLKNPSAMDGCGIEHRHLGMLRGEKAVRDVYNECDIVVSTSLYETLPGTLVEGQAYGCIPVSFDRGGQRDIVDHLSTGYIAEYSEDISVAARNIVEGILWASGRDEEIIEKMRCSVEEKFSYQSVAEKYKTLFHRLLKK